ncbi:MAG: dihydrolipoyl dehydrogenase [Candidatus Omnitrophica bacterium]|nr:dihydrolipoyl dehydrogenase [Candidatus Omnitrophota bacterium]
MPIYDLVIIGAGWAGFNAALRAKELGLKVCLIDSHQIGGTCLNYGCIPTKTLIACAKIFSLVKRSSNFGIELDNLRINLAAIQEKKDKVIRQLSVGMQSKLSGIDFINSLARIISAKEVKVVGRVINAKFILIATGSYPIGLPELKFDSSTSLTINPEQGRRIDRKKIISSDEALVLLEIPQSLLVIGAGVIGCEFASLFSILGAQVTIAEKMPLLLPAEDRDVSRKIEVIFKKREIKVVTGADISTFDIENYSKILVCVGRAPNTNGLGLEDLRVKLKNNRIVVDDYLKSSLDNIYAAGDCTGQLMLAHYAAYQGVMAVQNMFSSDRKKADNSVVPACIFTEPQIASVGVKENDTLVCAKRIKVHKFDFRASAMALIIDEAEGFVKIISNQETGQIIGASIIGPLATELIATLALAISCHLTVSEVGAMIFAHPTFSESLRETLNKP